MVCENGGNGGYWGYKGTHEHINALSHVNFT